MYKLILISLFIFSFNAFALQNSGSIVEYQTSSGQVVYLNESTFRDYEEKTEMYSQRLRTCTRGRVGIWNPFFGTNDYYEIIGRNNNGECVVEYLYADISKHRCALNRYQVEDLREGLENKFQQDRDLEFMNGIERTVYNSENCIVEYMNLIEGQASEEQIQEAVRKNPNLRSVLLMMRNSMQ